MDVPRVVVPSGLGADLGIFGRGRAETDRERQDRRSGAVDVMLEVDNDGVGENSVDRVGEGGAKRGGMGRGRGNLRELRFCDDSERENRVQHAVQRCMAVGGEHE